MTKEKITRIEFINVDDKENRKVIVTLTDGVKVTIWSKNGKYMTRGGSINVDGRVRNVIGAVIGYLLGDNPESLSYGECASAEAAFRSDLAISIPCDEELAAEMLLDFEGHLALFEDWEA